MAKKPAPPTAGTSNNKPSNATEQNVIDVLTSNGFKNVGGDDGNSRFVMPAEVTAVEGTNGDASTTVHLAGGSYINIPNVAPLDVGAALFS